ncbi:regulatory protein, luxR family [Streptomyces sp. TLI_053]|uniref:response regulator transcription factor n=1 Tax=Streptomyces sp. TLI_053 TaxID=1855352 RepID=UPI00087A88EC|nr:LuxR C-terminal-related transcriptional regulator [Streptomyces sp. TLI_053]SDT83244.1 regulatory protein, luxR family [Streptomyces sp. TLI_053]
MSRPRPSTTTTCLCEQSGPPAPPPPRDLSALTERETSVLLLLASGLGNVSIALRLGITERTVKKHVSSLFDKLGVRSRLEAALIAILDHDRICRRRAPS